VSDSSGYIGHLFELAQMGSPLLHAMLAAGLLAMVQGTRLRELPTFESFLELHGRSYLQGSAEFTERKALYEQRKVDSDAHNSNPNRLWTAGVNKLWDWTEAELKTLRGWDGSAMPAGGSSRGVRKHATFLQQQEDLPSEKMWTDLATAQHIRNQGDCGSCWQLQYQLSLRDMLKFTQASHAHSLPSKLFSVHRIRAIVEVMAAARVPPQSSPWISS
jgi:hypothetical protein